MSSQELQGTWIEAESWELDLLVSQGTSPGNMQTLTLLQTNLSMQSQGTLLGLGVFISVLMSQRRETTALVTES